MKINSKNIHPIWLILILFINIILPTTNYAKPSSENKNDQFEKIRNEYTKINDNIKSNKDVKIDVSTHFDKKSELLIYTANNENTKLVLNSSGEKDSEIKEFYYKNNQLIYIYTVKIKIDQKSDMTQRKENRYYIADNKIILWISHKGETVPDTNNRYEKKSEELIELSDKIIALAKANRKKD